MCIRDSLVGAFEVPFRFIPRNLKGSDKSVPLLCQSHGVRAGDSLKGVTTALVRFRPLSAERDVYKRQVVICGAAAAGGSLYPVPKGIF